MLAIEIAKKQRHALLLGRIKQNQALSPAELKELEQYERATPKKRTDTSAHNARPNRTRKSKSTSTEKRRRRLISPLRLQRLAYACDDMAEADIAAALPRPLADIIAGDAALLAAWRRGQFLRNLEMAACTMPNISRAARFLRIAGGSKGLREILDNDLEAGDVWLQNWIQTEIAVRQSIIENAKSGNQKAIEVAAAWAQQGDSDRPTGGSNFRRVTMLELADLMSVTRQAIDKWARQRSLPRNADGTFDLKEVFVWFETDVAAKIRNPGNSAEHDPMRKRKTQLIEIDIDIKLGRLLERGPVMTGFTARFQLLKASLSAFPRDIGPLLENRSLSQIQEILDKAVASLLEEQKKIPEELRLPDGAARSLAECLEQLL
ncbi:MAG: hypothetical protein QGD93_11235 [Actinomycetota bacterium]|nr:hypothetical protein [Actinomycetota bacterium]